MNEAVVNNMSIINGLNKVDGFDPSAFLRRLTGENGEEQFYLDVKYRKLWFRLMHSEGKITKRIIKPENEFAIIESRVYLNRNDAEDAYISCAFAQRWRKEDDAYGLKYVETAETAAVGRALADAGFGIQFSEPGEEQDRSLVDAPVTIPDSGLSEEMVQDESEEEIPDEVPQSTEKQRKALSSPEQKKAEWDVSMPVEELMQKMSLEDAKNYLIPIGAYKGKTLGELCIEKPGAVSWYVESYHEKNNVLRAGAKVHFAFLMSAKRTIHIYIGGLSAANL